VTETTVKIHAFRILRPDGSPPLEESIQQVANQRQLDRRVRSVGNKRIRAETVSHDNALGVYLMDMVWFRETHGPGKGSLARPVEGHEYEPDEYPTEDTAALYDPETRHLIVQYNHQGVRVGSLLDYFARYSADRPAAFEPQILLDERTHDRFANRIASRRIDISIAPQELTTEEWDDDVAVGPALRAGHASNARRASIQLSMGRERGTLAQGIERSLERIDRLIRGGESDGFHRVHVGVLEQVDAGVETLDLLNQRLTYEQTMELAEDRRIPRRDRWQALRVAFRNWRDRFV
jgi:hypothetical protein